MRENAAVLEKKALREKVLKKRAALGAPEREVLSARIFCRLIALPEYVRAETVLGYSAFGTEFQTEGFLRHALESGKRLVLPRVTAGGLVLHEVGDPSTELSPGTFDIPEPVASLPVVGLGEVDFVLVPGVAFERKGGRLGHGGGYYDRLLAGFRERPLLVGAAFEVQLLDDIPHEPHDVPLDLLVTEARAFRTGVSGDH